LARLKGFQELTTVDEALRKFFGALEIRKPRTISVPLDEALHRVLAKTIIAGEDLPKVDRSAVDGYAVKAKDTSRTSQFRPRILTVIERSKVPTGFARRLWTGDPLPRGANAVVMLENTKEVDGKIEVWTPLTPGENVSKRGGDVTKGESAAKAGIRLRPHHLGLIAALGISDVKVSEKPRIAILSTGNEVTEVGREKKENQVFDINRYTISALCRELGARPIDLGIARDEFGEITKKVKRGLEADAIISTGGTSVGELDLLPEVVNEIGRPGIVVHGIAMRPAMPTALAVADTKPILIFPGNPVAAMIAFEVFARPLICRMLGLNHEETRPALEAKMTRRITTALGRRTFVRVHVFQQEREYFAEPVSAKGSSLVSTMTKSSGYVVVPENQEGLEEGEIVLVRLFDTIEEV
jgi:molybdenum cofactor synthesis domain-containing protein